MNTTLKSFYSQGVELSSGLALMLLDICFPPRCASCDSNVDAEGNICNTCYAQLHQISAPLCHCCGLPFAFTTEHISTQSLCAGCKQQPPSYDSARAVWSYNTISAQLITRLKFGDHSTSLPRYAKLMANASTQEMQAVDAIIPVPLHWRRLMFRRYNQSALLAYCLAKELHIPVLANSLKRIRATTPQTRLKGDARVRNVKGAFLAKKQDICGKSILLVDDVMTTGATISACTKALKKADAASVHVITLARTTRE